MRITGHGYLLWGVVVALAAAATQARGFDGDSDVVPSHAVSAVLFAEVLGGIDDPDAPGMAWLGLRLEPPGPALDAHLGLGGSGLVVTDICVDSPADRAGLQRYDILRQFNGQDVPSHAGQFGRAIRKMAPETVVDIVVQRQAGEHKLTVSLAAIPQDPAQYRWRFGTVPEAIYKDNVVVTGKILRRGHNGEIVVQELSGPDIPKQFRRLLPAVRRRTLEVVAHDGQPKVLCQAVKGETTFMIECFPGAGIKVRRQPRDGVRSQEQVYPNEQALRQADEEAFAVFQASDAQEVLAHFTEDPNLALGSWVQSPGSVGMVGLTDSNPAAGSGDPSVAWQQVWRNWADVDVQSSRRLAQHLGRIEADLQRTHERLSRFERQFPAALISFKTDDDGTITVTRRQDDAESIRVFGDAEQLRLHNPILFERYLALDASE